MRRNPSTPPLIDARLFFAYKEPLPWLLYNLPNSQIAQLQKLQNAAARIVSLSSKRSHITPILETLHWLPVKERIIFKFFYLSIILSMEQPLITTGLCYDCTNLHEPYDPPILVFCKFRFPRNPGGNELLLMPDQPCGIHFHRSWRTQILQHPLSATLKLTCLIWRFEDRCSFFMVYMYIQFSCHVCNLFCLKLCCKAPWAFNQNGYGAI